MERNEVQANARGVRNVVGVGKSSPSLTAQVKAGSTVGQREQSKWLMNEAKNEHRGSQWLSIK